MRISDWSSDVCSSDLRRIADCRRFLNSAAGVVVIQPRDVAFVQDFAKLNLDEDQQLAACVADAVLGAAGNDYMVAGLELRDGFVDGGLDRTSVVEGKRVSVRVDLGGRRTINKKT